MIRLTELARTIRLYGQSSYPKRITGRFTIRYGKELTSCVDVVEGHVNKAGNPQRLISFADVTRYGMLSECLSSASLSEIEIQTETERFQFTIERVTVELTGISDEKATDIRYRGQVESRRNPGDLLTLFETDSPDYRRFYIEAPQEVIDRAEQCILDKGIADFTVGSTS